ncbi:hypothetical protein Moror_10312 [Moniliophthora roreri MCA 2997]|uniref:Uncharacterized protein n=2 Tax=Moniliophthora roreri TaxID=221103 RepID=V2WYS0_MONRO|nr:hypothetical protein Moror_10312 [Moniliophthora roreri MCA 2997]
MHGEAAFFRRFAAPLVVGRPLSTLRLGSGTRIHKKNKHSILGAHLTKAKEAPLSVIASGVQSLPPKLLSLARNWEYAKTRALQGLKWDQLPSLEVPTLHSESSAHIGAPSLSGPRGHTLPDSVFTEASSSRQAHTADLVDELSGHDIDKNNVLRALSVLSEPSKTRKRDVFLYPFLYQFTMEADVDIIDRLAVVKACSSNAGALRIVYAPLCTCLGCGLERCASKCEPTQSSSEDVKAISAGGA